MKALTRYLLILVMTLYSLAAMADTGSPRSLTLAEALRLSSENSYALRLALQQQAEARGKNLEAWSGILPRLSISENFMRSDDPVTVFGLKLKQGIFAASDFDLGALNAPAIFENYTTTFRLDVPLINLDAILGKSAATMMKQSAQAGADRTRQAVEYQTKSAYYGLILAHESLKAIDEALTSAQAHRDDASAALEQGIINQAAFLAAEVRLAELQEQLLIAESQVRNASDALSLTIGLDRYEWLMPTDSIMQHKGIAPDVNTDHLSRRPDLQAMAFREKAAARNLLASRSTWLPRLNAFGIQEWNADKILGNLADNFTVGAQLSWQIFDGFGRMGRQQQAAAQRRQATLQHRQALHQARNEYAAAQRGVHVSRKRIAVAEQAVAQARQSLHITEARYREGLEKTSDLLDREVMLTNARLRLLKAKHDYQLALSELTFVTGQ